VAGLVRGVFGKVDAEGEELERRLVRSLGEGVVVGKKKKREGEEDEEEEEAEEGEDGEEVGNGVVEAEAEEVGGRNSRKSNGRKSTGRAGRRARDEEGEEEEEAEEESELYLGR